MVLKRFPDKIIKKLELKCQGLLPPDEDLTPAEGVLMRQRLDEFYEAIRGLSPGELVYIDPVEGSEDLIVIRQKRELWRTRSK